MARRRRVHAALVALALCAGEAAGCADYCGKGSQPFTRALCAFIGHKATSLYGSDIQTPFDL